jgi:hypothetical protein
MVHQAGGAFLNQEPVAGKPYDMANESIELFVPLTDGQAGATMRYNNNAPG